MESWMEDTSTVPFFNRVAHNKGFHPTEEYKRWYDLHKSDMTKYKVRTPIALATPFLKTGPQKFEPVYVFSYYSDAPKV